MPSYRKSPSWVALSSYRKPPSWAALSLFTNALLILTLGLWIWQQSRQETPGSQSVPDLIAAVAASNQDIATRERLTYQQWVVVLEREAKAMAAKNPARLTILAGDSISLWFPNELLPADRTWLNQGISGETSLGLLKRLPLLDQTRPTTILVMIGINDLAQGVSDEALLGNYREIVAYLRRTHPKSQLVIQSILPHSGEGLTGESRARLWSISNDRIRRLNRQLLTIARESGAYYFDLQPLFTDPEGNLRMSLSTDGLHLNYQGYLVWRTGLQLFSQLKLEPPEKAQAIDPP